MNDSSGFIYRMNRYYYMGPWIWRTDEDDVSSWAAPPNTIGSFDLRSLSPDLECGFFCTSVPIRDSNYAQIGDGSDFREYHTTQKERDAWRSLLSLNIAELPDSVTLFRDIVIKTFEELGDPDGEKRFLPPTATNFGNWEFKVNRID